MENIIPSENAPHNGATASTQVDATVPVSLLLDRAIVAGINPDALTQTRRQSDAGRQFPVQQTQPWTEDMITAFQEWYRDAAMDLDIQIKRLSVRHNQVALHLYVAECRYYKQAGYGVADRQIRPVNVVPGTEELRREWAEMDEQLRLLKHFERILAPVEYLFASIPEDLPLNDPLLLALWDLIVSEGSYFERRGKGDAQSEVEGSIAAEVGK